MRKQIGRDASLSRKTVTAVSKGEVKVTASGRTYTRRASALTVIEVDPELWAEVWATALALAEGDAYRIERVSPTAVRVHNNRTWKRRMSS